MKSHEIFDSSEACPNFLQLKAPYLTGLGCRTEVGTTMDMSWGITGTQNNGTMMVICKNEQWWL